MLSKTENETASDAMVVRTRRALLAAASNFERDGNSPALVDEPFVVQAARSGSFIAPAHLPWREAYLENAKRAKSPAETLKQAVEKFFEVSN